MTSNPKGRSPAQLWCSRTGVCGEVLGEGDVLMREELTIKKTLASQNSREESCKGHLIRVAAAEGEGPGEIRLPRRKGSC